MSKILLAEGQITPTDRLVIQLVESIENPARGAAALACCAVRSRSTEIPRRRERDHGHLGGRRRSAVSDQLGRALARIWVMAAGSVRRMQCHSKEVDQAMARLRRDGVHPEEAWVIGSYGATYVPEVEFLDVSVNCGDVLGDIDVIDRPRALRDHLQLAGATAADSAIRPFARRVIR
jgi:hypothetical protein